MFDTNVTIVTETDMAAQKREWLTVDAQPTPTPARTFCEGWQAWKQDRQYANLATHEALAGWEEAQGVEAAVKFPRWAVTYSQGWGTYKYFRPVGAIIRSNEALRGWKAAREDHLAMDVDKWEVTL